MNPEFLSWIPWLVVFPLMGAIVTFTFPRIATWAGLFTGVLILVATVGLVAQTLAYGANTYSLGGWGAPLGIDFRVDGLSAWMLVISAVVGACVSLYAIGYFPPGSKASDEEKNHKRRYFWPLWMFLWAGLNGLFLSNDIFNLYITLEMVGFSAVALVALANSRNALTAAMRYLLVGLMGSLFFLLGVAFLYGTYGTLDLTLLGERSRANMATWVAISLMTAGLIVKTAAFPLHFWLPPAHSNAPTPVSALLSALVTKGPFYILLRLWFFSFASLDTTYADYLFGALGAMGLIWGAAHALRQSRLKLLVAYSTVAQLGYLFLVFPLARAEETGFTAWTGVLLFLAAHALAKTAMFMAAGNILQALGHDTISRLAGISRLLPKSVFALALAGVSLMGLPPSGGFIGKWLLLDAAISQGRWWIVIAVLCGTALAIGYVVRVIRFAFEDPIDLPQVKSVSAVMEWTALATALLASLMALASSLPLDLITIDAPAHVWPEVGVGP